MNRTFFKVLRAVCSVAVVFASAYFCLQYADPSRAHFKKDADEMHGASLLDCAYFSLVTQSTVGYGAMVPHSVAAKSIAAIQMLSVLAMFAYFATHAAS